MTRRILIYGNHDATRNLYSLFLRSCGYEVFNYPSPITCTLVVEQKCASPGDHVCADVIIADMDMQGMTGLELIRYQKEMGCHVPPQNKAVLSPGLTTTQQQEVLALGCKSLEMPFELQDLLAWVNECEKNIPHDRKLAPYKELPETVSIGCNLTHNRFVIDNPAFNR